MASQECALYVNKIVPLREEVTDQSTLNQRQALCCLLPGFGNEFSNQQDPFSDLRILQMLHQPEIVQLSFGTRADAIRLPNIKRFEASAKAAAKDIDARNSGKLF